LLKLIVGSTLTGCIEKCDVHSIDQHPTLDHIPCGSGPITDQRSGRTNEMIKQAGFSSVYWANQGNLSALQPHLARSPAIRCMGRLSRQQSKLFLYILIRSQAQIIVGVIEPSLQLRCHVEEGLSQLLTGVLQASIESLSSTSSARKTLC
jgi:hypothetical protein